MSSCIVFYETWQLQCCGTPFKVGDTIEWMVVGNNPQIADDISFDTCNIDYIYDAHLLYGTTGNLVGRVTSIKHLYRQYTPLPDNPKHFTLAKNILIDAKSANGREADIEGISINAYIAVVEDYKLFPDDP